MLYKKQFKLQQLQLKNARQELVRLNAMDNDDDDDDDDNGSGTDGNASTSASSTSSKNRQLAGFKRKRKQGLGERIAKSSANMKRKQLSTNKAIKPCGKCMARKRFDVAYTHSRSSSSICPFMSHHQDCNYNSKPAHRPWCLGKLVWILY
ncbi:unnamed protein product [Absidia cylindrospora]